MVCTPVSKVYDPLDRDQRLQDQVGYGFPFTSVKYPWPVDSKDRPKQPVIQIDLANASHKLNANLGDGLVQIWMCAYTDQEEPEVELRYIEIQDLGDEISEDYPSEPPWLREDGSFNSSRFHCDFLSSPLIEWKQIGYLLPDDLALLSTTEDFASIRKLLEHPEAKKIYYECLGDVNKEYDSYIDSTGTQMLSLLGGHTVDWGDNYLYYHEIPRPDIVPATSKESRLLFHVKWDNGVGSSGIFLIAGGGDLYCDIYERYNS